MNLLPRRIIFIVHFLLLLLFLFTHRPLHFQLLLPILFHYLVIKNDSTCYSNHCLFPSPSQYQDPGVHCQQPTCGVARWMRMKHCFKCNRCIHKYDHHCVLMDICVGEFNHRYYFLFLFTFLWNTILMVYYLTLSMKDEVTIDQNGLQSFSLHYYFLGIAIVCLYFSLILTGYLAINHLYFVCVNTTTWEYYKRKSIVYLKQHPRTYPFSQGVVYNLAQLFWTDPGKPIDWSLTLQPVG